MVIKAIVLAFFVWFFVRAVIIFKANCVKEEESTLIELKIGLDTTIMAVFCEIGALSIVLEYESWMFISTVCYFGVMYIERTYLQSKPC